MQDKRLLLGQGTDEGPAVLGAREMFIYLHQYLTAMEAEVSINKPQRVCYCHTGLVGLPEIVALRARTLLGYISSHDSGLGKTIKQGIFPST